MNEPLLSLDIYCFNEKLEVGSQYGSAFILSQIFSIVTVSGQIISTMFLLGCFLMFLLFLLEIKIVLSHL